MVLMALVGGVRSLFGPLLGAVLVGVALEYFKLEFGDSQFHLVATGLLLAAVVLFMPDGVIPALSNAVKARSGGGETSIREMTAEELAQERADAEAAASTAPAASKQEVRR
jgi:branched-chain amino acid transport system permease protein